MFVVPGPAGRGAPSELAELLGPERAAAVAALLLARAVAWGEGLAGAVSVLDGGLDDLARAVRERSGPVLIAWAGLPTWRDDNASGVLDDLASGCDLSVGPVFDGGLYLLGLARPEPSLFDLPPETWEGPNILGELLGLAARAELSAGLLRPERGLRGAGDVQAALADPLTDPELAGLLRGA